MASPRCMTSEACIYITLNWRIHTSCIVTPCRYALLMDLEWPGAGEAHVPTLKYYLKRQYAGHLKPGFYYPSWRPELQLDDRGPLCPAQSRCVHDGEPWTTRCECQAVCRRRFVEATSCVGDLFADANREGRSQFGSFIESNSQRLNKIVENKKTRIQTCTKNNKTLLWSLIMGESLWEEWLIFFGVMTEQWVSPPRNNVRDTGQIGSVGDFCISDEVTPAYDPEDHTLAAHLEGLELP